ncbi:condensin-2 complex subunit G2 isoform X3 [Octopus sinensis]|uniref:Condensin-2 complex subunit G2 isoform X3 n=1 Tax=Octopus sinensis TaxID=2607531 RepID=A0A7E6ETF4_9MOLL|nr:condensin-2 complex subunit G2 isoform X3 [Octopus sinensis]
MVMRNQLTAIAAKEDPLQLVAFMIQTKSNSHTEWEEVLSGYSRRELEELWQNLLKIATSLLLGLESSHDSSQEEMEKVFKSLDCLIVLATATVVSNKLQIPPSLLEMSILLHDLLLSLPDTADNLKNNFSKLFETFWTKEKPGREYVFENTLHYLFQVNLKSKSTLKTMKRLWQLRSAFPLIKFDDPSSQDLKNLICESLVSPSFMKKEEGVRVLGSILPLNLDFMKTCHEVIKKSLVTVPKNFIPKYGPIYFRAWQMSNEEAKLKIETGSIQDIMYNAIHASGIQLVKDLRKIIAYIHRQKKQKGVAEMLHRLYAPLLWRSLKILLMDPCPSIRSRTILGVCQILSAYWQMIPKEVTRTYITTLIEDLAWDNSSAEVRESVLKGIVLLFNCHYCHLILHPILPELQNLFHDSSEKVRIAMVNLLIKVKGLRKVKYWSIVPVEHLLARLATDSQPVARRIMKVIFSNFLPLDKTVEVQIIRIISLIESNPQAARIFFQHAPKFMSLEQVVSFIVLLCSCILRHVRDKKHANDDSILDSEMPKDKSSDLEEDCGNEAVSFDLEKNIIHGFLDSIIILWTVIEPEFAKTTNHVLKEKLDKIFSKALSIMMREFKDSQLRSALIIIAGKLPPKLVPYLSHQCLSKLQKLSDTDSVKEDFSALIQTTCSWGQMKGLLDLIQEWLTDGMKTKLNSSLNSKQSKRSQQVRFREEVIPKPMLALKFLLFVIEQPNCRALLLNKYQSNIIGILEQLKFVLNLLEQRLTVGLKRLQYADDTFLQAAYYLYIRINLLLYVGVHSENDEGIVVSLEEIMKQFCTWAQNIIVPVFNNQNSSEKAIRKRHSSDSKENSITFSCNLLEHLFTLTHTYLLMFKINETQYYLLSELFHCCFTNVHSLKLLPIIIKCLIQIVSVNLSTNHDIQQTIHESFKFLLETLVALATSKSDTPTLTLILNSSRLHMSNLLSTIYEFSTHRGTMLSCFFQTILTAILSELSFASEQNDINEVPSNFQNIKLVSLWLLNIIFKKPFLIRYFLKELHTFTQSKPDTFKNYHQFYSLLYLLNTLNYSPKCFKSEMKDLWLYIKQSDIFPSQTALDAEDDIGVKLSIKGNITSLNMKLCDQAE